MRPKRDLDILAVVRLNALYFVSCRSNVTRTQERRIAILAAEKKKVKAAIARLTARLREAGRECVAIKDEQGQVLHDLLQSQESKEVFMRLPSGSDQRAIYEVSPGPNFCPALATHLRCTSTC